MRLEDFDYDLPANVIAQQPVEPRDAARLLVDQGPRTRPLHRAVRDLPHLLAPGDLVVVNDSRVIPARLQLQRVTGGAVEVLLLEALDEEHRSWECLIRPARKLRRGEELAGTDGRPFLVVGARTEAGDTFVVELCAEDAMAALDSAGQVPVPPYITAPLGDPDRYQTVYADRPGSAAAPTAGLHLTAGLLDELAAVGIRTARVELVIGLDTFQPVTAADPGQHPIHSERYTVPAETLAACREAQRVVAVGTTTVRALESAATTGQASGRTRLFIHRPYDWQVVDLLLTNFHLPRTTLLMMIDAFIGARWRDLYRVALDDGYRFLSFGDAMLLRRGRSMA
ncbi:MAG TPA: tRNA preQ1(34) S-adenosylmethionine ribosyltransferase-isomerase QueA [Acidimicrobiales bacterium]|nr:tRNA preQ1(34) S-adenosylmethionine ribosyltransferase-isomerase QueA [Acidimicrobiales bacterium]